MHMADALLSPTVGLSMWAVATVAVGLSARRLAAQPDDRRVPLMGVLGAFLFAAQMINFSIPGTGSSGHLGGGLLLAILLGPEAAVLVMASVLIVQALFFADGGLLALGCNIVNLGVVPALIGLPLYRWLAGSQPGAPRAAWAAVAAAVVSLQIGALGVVLQTVASGISALPLGTFLAFMQPIHLGIGLVEGLVTAAIVGFVARTRPDILQHAGAAAGRSLKGLLAAFGLSALVVGGVGAWYAAEDPDGLEWSIARAAGGELPEPESALHGSLARLQGRTALLPDYGFPAPAAPAAAAAQAPVAPTDPAAVDEAQARLGTSVSGLVGGLLTLLLALGLGALATRWPSRR